MNRRSWTLFAAMCVIWGIPYLLIRVAVRDIEPGTLVFMRTIIGGLLLLPLALRGGGFGPVLARWKPLLAFTLIEMVVPWTMLGTAEQHLSSSLSGLLLASVPLIALIAARLAGSREPIGRRRWSGLLLGLVGVGLLVGLDVGGLDAVALLEVLVVAIGYATAPLIMARSLSDIPSIPVVSASLLLASLITAPYAAFNWPSHVAGRGIASVITLGVVCTALAFVLFFALIAEIGPARSVVITYVNPAVAVALGLLLLGEEFTAGMGIGFPLILVGSVLAAAANKAAVPAVELPDVPVVADVESAAASAEISR